MSKKTGTKTPRRNTGAVIFLVLTGVIIFVAITLTLVYGFFYSSDEEIVSKIRNFSDRMAEKLDPVSVETPDEVAGVSEQVDVVELTVEDTQGEDFEKPGEPMPEPKNMSVDSVSEQNGTVIHLTDIEMTDKVLVATFKIVNNSQYTMYFPFYGTNASYDDNGGSMYRDLDSEKDADYDQIPTVINSGEEVIGRIAYTPLIYYDKPFTIYISGVKFREVDTDWKSYEFYFDPNEDL